MTALTNPTTPRPSVGPRRQDHQPAPGADLSRTFLVGATLLLAAVAGVVLVAGSSARFDPNHGLQLQRALWTVSAVSGLAVLFLCRARWAEVGEGAALWAGAATFAVGVASLARPELTGAILGGHGPGDRLLTALSNSALVWAPLLFAAGLVPRIERWPVRPSVVMAAASAAIAVTALALRAAGSDGSALQVSALTSDRGNGPFGLGLLVAGGWLLLAVGYTFRGLRRRWLYTWGGLTLFALTASGLAAGFGQGPHDPWSVGAAAIGALGLLLAVAGCAGELGHAYAEQHSRLFDTEVDIETNEVRARLRAATSRTRRHDLANAITAIEGAAMILEREFDKLTDNDRETLARVLGSGTGRLRRLLAQETAGTGEVALADAAGRVAGEPGWEEHLRIDVDPDLVGAGSVDETAEAVRQLVDYARRRDGSAPVTIRGERDGEWVVLRVEDRGPGMSRQQRRSIAGAEPPRGPGGDDQMALRVAARLMREQGGDLWVEARSGGGSSFGICLPAIDRDEEAGGGAGR